MAFVQTIYYGVPGTGKSYAVDQYLKEMKVKDENIFRVTFHPDYTYSDFIGQILPTSKNNEISYNFEIGIFTQSLQKAFKDNSQKIYLVIEEINRGNVSAIFGDIFQLLDRNDDNQSRYPVRNALISEKITQIDNLDDIIYLPPNFNIIATMNTSDQNLFVMDNAFKRRFNWKYISTLPVLEKDGSINENFTYDFELPWRSGMKKLEWTNFYIKLNSFITDRVLGLSLREDKQIGQFFIDYNKNTDKNIFQDNIREKLMHYLWNDIHLVAYTNVSLFYDAIMNYSELHARLQNGDRIFSEEFMDYFEK